MNDLWTILIIGSIPTLSMLFTSLLVIYNDNITVNKFVEAGFQMFCSGLILAATSIELFPLLDDNNGMSLLSVFAAIWFGFSIGLIVIYGVNIFVNSFEDNESLDISISSKNSEKTTINYNSISSDEENSSTVSHDDDFEWEDNPVMHSLDALSLPDYKNKLVNKLNDVNDSITTLDQKISDLYCSSNFQHKLIDYEDLTETIDKLAHTLEYQLDTSKRLIEAYNYDANNTSSYDQWLTDTNKKNIIKATVLLKQKSNKILELAADSNLDVQKIRGIHRNILNMHSIMNRLHSKVETVSTKWMKRYQVKSLPIPLIGSPVPMSLVVPVCIDGIVDGFLIGLTYSISPRIGYIITFADALEMGFLGIAVSMRIRKCTGSPLLFRYTCLILPPIFLLISAVFGMLFGNLTKEYPFLYISFISFGIVALVSLAVNELFWESRNSLDGNDYWWNSTILFFGIYIIIFISKLLP